MERSSLIHEFWEYLKLRKRYWLLPLIVMLSLIGTIIILSEGSTLAPFIYALF